MISDICQKEIAELVEQGWTAIVGHHGSEIVGIRSVAGEWGTLDWAHRVFFRAKYGFDESGVLVVPMSELRTPSRARDFFYREPQDEILLPDRAMPGSNKRLRELLENDRTGVEAVGYDHTARLFIGTDGSSILTTEPCWGIPSVNDTDFIEPDNAYTCYWDETNRHNWLRTAPWWSMPSID